MRASRQPSGSRGGLIHAQLPQDRDPQFLRGRAHQPDYDG
jgi:hypothetical protein